ncbi:hypothetical protein EW146_g5690 [Bondarzewia mesenterica]|uniref:VTT domain-containing protein n=1 Tax=Bondarzewia mesenterica TaxID=1095465 RepID=A0A4S4LQQ5_9AGAM|nr:hypothetical protein EW146_g5690 [Bondarzewia mesenterica]
MATLAPPPSRHRASSTNLRPALTISTLGARQKSCSYLEPVPCTPPIAVESAKVSSPLSSPSRFSVLVERCMELLHVDANHTYSTPSSPRSSNDETILPMSATQTTFGNDFVQEKPSYITSSASRTWWQSPPSVHAPLFLVLISFPVSTAIVVFALWSLPFSVSWPRTLADCAQLGRELHGYSQSGFANMAHVVGIISVITIWMHAWSIPGSVLWNVLAGALFSPILATLLLSALTTIGSVFASLLSTPLAPFLIRYFPRSLALARSAFESEPDVSTGNKSKSPAWVRLVVLRLIGIVPWSGINIACGVCGVALADCLLGTFIGSLPWTAVTCQIGDILQTVASTPSPNPETISSILASPAIIFKLAFLSFLSLAPILGRDYLRAVISPAATAGSTGSSLSSDRVSRWTWVRDWRSKVRIPSRSRPREQTEKVEVTLAEIDEKQRLQRILP